MALPHRGARVFVLGLDGVPWEFLHSLMERGRLPTFASLYRRSARGVVRSTLPPNTGPAWTSFATGVNPGKHGIFRLYHVQEDFRLRPVTSHDIKVPTLPQVLSDQGFRSIVVNLPVSSPPKPFRGIQAADILSPEPYISPGELSHYLNGYRVFYDIKLKGEARIDDIIDVEKRRLGLALRLLKEQPWDMFFVLVSGTDWLSHYCYGEMLNGGPRGDRALGLLDEVDAFLGHLIGALPGDATLIMLSDHGFQACDHVFDLNGWLWAGGYARRRTEKPEGEDPRIWAIDPSSRALVVPPWLVQVARRLPWIEALGSKLIRVAGRREIGLQWRYTVDIPNSRAFTFRGQQDGIYINREVVRGDQEYRSLVEELVTGLRGLGDTFKGSPAFSMVRPRAEVYSGDQLQGAPDILCVPTPGLYVSGNFFPEGRFTAASTNWHTLEGFLLICGPTAPSGAELGTVNLWDLAPTILRLLDATVPEWMEGTPLKPFLADSTTTRGNAGYPSP